MAHYDAIFKNGTIANHDGIHPADVGIRDGRIAALGDLGGRYRRRQSPIAPASTSSPASSTPRCISASPVSITRKISQPARCRP